MKYGPEPNPTTVRQSIVTMNQDAHTTPLDGFTQATKLAQYNITHEIKRIHVDAIASNNLGSHFRDCRTAPKTF